MISPIKGWSWSVSGGDVHLTSDAGAKAGSIRYTERKRPLLSLPQVLGQADSEGFSVSTLVTIRNLVTHEGEFGMLALYDGTLAGRPAQRVFGIVFGDDFYALVDGLSISPDHWPALAATVEQLTMSDTHLLGVRRRRYPYVPPAEWREVRTLFHVHYLAPRREAETNLVVCPAVPCLREEIESTLIGDARCVGTPRAITTPSGLSGSVHEIELAGGRRRLVALLEDTRYVYPAFLDGTGPFDPAERAAFDQLVQSIQMIPAPQPRAFVPRPSPVSCHWID